MTDGDGRGRIYICHNILDNALEVASNTDINLPELQGSEEQIKWASSIRKNFLGIIPEATTETSADWWIDNRDAGRYLYERIRDARKRLGLDDKKSDRYKASRDSSNADSLLNSIKRKVMRADKEPSFASLKELLEFKPISLLTKFTDLDGKDFTPDERVIEYTNARARRWLYTRYMLG
jgi:hypothetical protein